MCPRVHIHIRACAALALALLGVRARAELGARALPDELPPLLVYANGSTVPRSAEGWAARRAELGNLLERHILGAAPVGAPPQLVGAVRLNCTGACGSPGGGSGTETPSDAPPAGSSEYFQLTFAREGGREVANNCSFAVEVLRPAAAAAPGEPLQLRAAVLTQWNHRGWALAAAERGAIGVRYPACDLWDVSPCFAALYAGDAPQPTWALIRQRAYVTSRVVDFLTSPRLLPGVDTARIGVTGHSRNGKLSMVAGAFDERITAVAGSSPGWPIATPARMGGHEWYGETTMYVKPARGWWLQSLAAYDGRENALPADGHFVHAMMAPRALCTFTGWTDWEGDATYGGERATALAYEGPYAILDAQRLLRVRVRPGPHHGFLFADALIDWFAYAFGGLQPRAAASASGDVVAVAEAGTEHRPFSDDFPAALSLHHFDWGAWDAAERALRPPPPAANASAWERLSWLYHGELAGGAPRGVGLCSPSEAQAPEFDFEAGMMRRDNGNGTLAFGKVVRTALSFGAYTEAHVYTPVGKDAASTATAPLPGVVWLHPYSYQSGSFPAYHTWHDAGTPYHLLASHGFAALAYDMAGFGTRVDEGSPRRFYARHPTGSRLGLMVQEALQAADALACLDPARRHTGACVGDGGRPTGTYPARSAQLPYVDASRVYVLGYSLGGAVALHALAADRAWAAAGAARAEVLAGGAAIAAFTPLSDAGSAVAVRARASLARWHALAPRVGLFDGGELPADACDELLPLAAGAAGRPLLLLSPLRDQYADAAAVRACVARASVAWDAKNASSALVFEAPDTISDLNETTLLRVADWLSELAGAQADAGTGTSLKRSGPVPRLAVRWRSRAAGAPAAQGQQKASKGVAWQ